MLYLAAGKVDKEASKQAQIEQKRKANLGALWLISLTAGMVCGRYLYGEYMAAYWKYEGSRIYRNLLPSEPAAAYSDAGKIHFADVSTVETHQSVGYMHGKRYCVAPIMDPYSTTRVEFWAVGLDCCDQRNHFYCDDSGDLSVHAGAVLVDENMLKAELLYYKRAVSVAEAAFSLVSAEDPIFVHWVRSPEAYQAAQF